MKRADTAEKKTAAVLPRVIAVVFALSVWQAAAMLLDQSILLASPLRVLVRLAGIWLEPGFWSMIRFSLLRITCGFLLGFVTGTVLAVLAGRFSWVETMLRPFVVTIKSVPVASFIIICLIWLTSAQLSIFISFLMVFPVIYANVLEGLHATDLKLLQMARLYHVPWRRRLGWLYLPQLRPFLLSACSTALGLSWKAGIAAEIIGIPDGSMGEALYEAKVYFNTVDLFAWTVIIVLVSVLFEKAFLWLMRLAFGRLEKL